MNKMIDVSKSAGITRRFLMVGATAAGGLAIASRLSPGALAQAPKVFAQDIFFSMGENGVTTVHVMKAELGQHVGTAIAQSLAEELEVDWKDIRIDYPSSDPKWGLILTGGSWSINWTFLQMSRLGVAGRQALVAAAAGRLGVPSTELTAAKSMITHQKSGRSISYADLVKQGVKPLELTKEQMLALPLKKPSERKLVGQSVPQLDIRDKVFGTGKYSIDVVLDRMVYGCPVTPPVRFGAKVKSVDDAAARSVKGYLRHIVINDATQSQTGWVVVVASSYPAARRAAAALKVEYDLGPNTKVSSATIKAEAASLLADKARAVPFEVLGNSSAALRTAAKTISAEYTNAIAVHSPLEPMVATAEVINGVYHIHAGHQFATLLVDDVSKAMGVDKAKVVHHQYYLGGGFGRRLESDYPIIAAICAREAGRPVKVIYDRETDHRFSFPRTSSVQQMRGGLSADGKPIAVEHDIVAGWYIARLAPAFLADSPDGSKRKVDPFTAGGSDFWYTVPNHTVRLHQSKQIDDAVRPGALRSVSNGYTWWAVESFIDELAHAAGRDPVEFRLELLSATGKNAGTSPNSVGGAARLKTVIEAAAQRTGIGRNPREAGIGFGISATAAVDRSSPTWSACVARVKVDRSSGSYEVQKLSIVMDVGTAVNPDGVRSQIESSVLWGLSLATKESVEVVDGRLDIGNYDSYPVLQGNEVPEIDIFLMPSTEMPVGCGEPGTSIVAPAIANAIFNASGARVRSLPITSAAIKAAI